MTTPSAPPTTPHPVTLRELIAALPELHRGFGALLERLSRGHGAVAVHETIAAARPALLASLYARLGGVMVVVLPTPDAAERAYADLLAYLGEEDGRIALVRPRDESLGALESPSERSARMTLLADLSAGQPRLVLAPVSAMRQTTMAPHLMQELRFTLRVGQTPGWEATLARLHRLGYDRSDVVGAAGEYAVRGGILDIFTAGGQAPTRIEFFGDTIESIRTFAIESQRSNAELDAIEIAPWREIVRDEAVRARILERLQAPASVVAAVAAYIERGNDIPDAWLSLAQRTQATLLDYLPNDALVVLDEPSMLSMFERSLDDERERERSAVLAEIDRAPDELSVAGGDVEAALLAEVSAPHPHLADLAAGLRARTVLTLPGGIESEEATTWVPEIDSTFVVASRPIDHFNRQIELFTRTLREWVGAGETVVIATSSIARMRDLLSAAGIEATQTYSPRSQAHGGVILAQGSLESGFVLPDVRLRILGDREIFGQPPKRVKLRAIKEGVPVTLADLKVGDYVVHSVHGIGRYVGLRTETILGATQDYLDLQYAGNDRMLIPVTQMHHVAKYSASEGQSARLSKMGGADWARSKSRVSESLAKIADGLVQLYAERELARGHAFAADTPWQTEMEEAFAYEPTPDQRKAIDDVKADMERARPMDRLVCGDVGYGKTEVALRAAFKAVADKRQVAILVPTTLLADQHYHTFSTRFAGFPIRIEELSRFKSKAEQRETLRDLALGRVDIVVGTHRLLQKDVTFADLGLIVIDEEQRFGVAHKERLKALRTSVDVLTLSATPIPRTLHMSLVGVRDLSLIRTAPRNRMSIKTVVVPGSDAIVQRAVTAELDRGGQIYYLHNRVESIHAVHAALAQLVPRARIAVGHGQMGDDALEPIMASFIAGDIDVLVATTIIENGIDIPNVNTMIVADADKFGLAQLYQLRGRVGRSNHQAYCYLLYQGHKALSEDAKARLEAIREFTHLGSGLQIAMRDLEIRGAGNLLGAAQSGFIASVGFDTYCQLLAEAIAERQGKGTALAERREAVIDVKIDAFVPNDYIPQVSQKIAVYQELARARSVADVEAIAEGVRDRFGPLPQAAANLVELTKLRAIALGKHVTRVIVDEHRLTLGVGSGFALQPSAVPRFQSLTKNRFRFAEGKMLIDLPPPRPGSRPEETWMPLLRGLLEAM
ncbi:MAG: transcription-repair coupling factor [Vulcanimicrobiaceae bacterium]